MRPFKKALHVVRGTKEHKYHKYTAAMPLVLPEIREQQKKNIKKLREGTASKRRLKSLNFI